MLYAILLITAAFVTYFLLDEVIRNRRLPPGPFPLPVIGNLHLLSNRPHLDMYRLVSRYGALYRLRLGCNRVVVINNHAFAKEAMVKKGADFAGRPPQFAGSLFSRDGKGIGFQGYTRRLKLQRKTLIQTIRKFEKNSKLEDIVARELQGLISRMRNKPEGTAVPSTLRADITKAKSNIVASLTFGERFSDGSREFSQLLETLTTFVEALGATSFIDTFPFLKHVPFKIINELKRACSVRDKIFDAKFTEHKENVFNKNSEEAEDLTDALLHVTEKSRGRPEEDLTDDHIVMTMNDTIIAGSESPATNMLWIIYLLVKHPEMQQRIQQDLDDVIGRHRPPKWSDRQNLPYLEAFTLESMRRISPMPLAIPHQATADTSLGPYQIPKGTTVMLNLYAIHHDRETWENPHEFNPERFLNKDGTFNAENSSKVIPYGIGHRVCPGELLARMEVFLFTSSLLQHFTFDCDEGDVLPDVEDSIFGIVLRPPTFRISVTKRP